LTGGAFTFKINFKKKLQCAKALHPSLQRREMPSRENGAVRNLRSDVHRRADYHGVRLILRKRFSRSEPEIEKEKPVEGSQGRVPTVRDPGLDRRLGGRNCAKI